MSTQHLLEWLSAELVILACFAFFMGKRKALGFDSAGTRMASQPGFYGWYALIWLVLPLICAALLTTLIRFSGIAHPSAAILLAVSAIAGLFGFAFAMPRIQPQLRARQFVERFVRGLLIAAALVSILTTIGIVLSLIFEAVRFYRLVGFWEFITGTKWDADTAFLAGAGRETAGAAKPLFGALPIFAGTFGITLIAMLVAAPLGLYSAIYLSEYASQNMRATLKPILEVLAGIPTVVYGFFAAITVSPLIVDLATMLGLEAEYTNALSPGIVMGIMIIPFVSSLSDDVIHAVPQSMRDGSLALGTTHAETVRKVVLPAALPGILSAFLLAISRAIGETMIVVMAAGVRPNLTMNPLESMTTVTVKIVEALTGDQEFDSALTLSAFGLGLVLLVVTLILNVASAITIRRFKRRYAQV